MQECQDPIDLECEGSGNESFSNDNEEDNEEDFDIGKRIGNEFS